MFTARYAFRVGLTRRGPTCAHLFVVHPQRLTDGCLLYIIINFHPFYSGGGGDGNVTGRISLETEKGEMILCLVFIFLVAGLLSPSIASAMNEEGKAGCGGGGGGGWVVRKRDRKGLKASL